jgi:transposase
MTISAHVHAEARRLFYAEHWKVGTIAANLGLHPDTVKAALERPDPSQRVTVARSNLLEPYQSLVVETLQRFPRLRSTRIYDMLCERGYKGSARTVRRYVAEVRPRPVQEVFLRIESLPGEQAQVDWAKVGSLRVPGGTRALWVFVMVLAYSRAMWAELVLDLDARSLRRSLIRAAYYFGGCTRQWLFDNPKTIVLERSGDAVRYHPVLLETACSFHVQPRLCRVRKPVDKAKVERSIRHLKERFFAARPIHSIAEGNAQLLRFIDEVALSRPHPCWPERSVREVFEEERQHLLSLPATMPSEETVAPVLVDRTAFVRLETNRYSVPPEFAGRTLMAAISDGQVRLLDGVEQVAAHERNWGRHQVVEQESHRAALLQLKRAARPAKGRERLLAEVPGIDLLINRWVDTGRSLGWLIGRTVALLNAYGPAILGAAVADMHAKNTHDLGALTLLCEQHRRAANVAVLRPLSLSPHVVDRDVIQHDLGGYDG